MEGAAQCTQAPLQGLSSPPRGPSASRRPPQQGSNISSQNSHPNQLKRNAVIERGNHSKLEKQDEAEQEWLKKHGWGWEVLTPLITQQPTQQLS